MRLLAVCASVVLCAACGPSPGPEPATSALAPTAAVVNPARIDRSRSELPHGYEVSAYPGPPAPIAVWGLRAGSVTDPAQCAELATPAVDPATAKGWSASGPGGIVYAVVAAGLPTSRPDPALPGECGRWTVSSGPTTAVVTRLPGPVIDAADTVGMRTAATTVVEGGTETRSRAETFVAYLDDYVCFVSLVTDPGSPHAPLRAGFASDLLAETVSALRG